MEYLKIYIERNSYNSKALIWMIDHEATRLIPILGIRGATFILGDLNNAPKLPIA